jgi:hypothetical protein
LKPEPIELIDLVFKHSKLQRIPLPQMTRLVKLLYLTEVEYYRQKRERLTNLDWTFYYYGPYPPNLKTVLGEPEIETFYWKGGKTSQQLVRDEGSFMEAFAESDIESLISNIVKQWGDADLNQLLDYVYFETEPMQQAKRGELLDFSLIESQGPRKIEIKLDPVRLKDLRNRVAERSRSYSALRRPLLVSRELAENLEIWDADRGKQFATGPCTIRVDDLIPEE